MKTTKKIVALVIAMMIVSAMAISAFAVSITINPPANTGNTSSGTQTDSTQYTWYRIFEADIEKDPSGTVAGGQTGGSVAYYVDTQAKATAIESTQLFNVVKVDGEDKWYVELKSSSTNAQTIADAFAKMTKTAFDHGTQSRSGTTSPVVITGLDEGYYYIESTLGNKVIIATLTDVEVTEKNSYPGGDKEITNSADEHMEIGKDITYTLTVSLPASANDKLTLTDTLSKGLTFKGFSGTIPYSGTPSDIQNGTSGSTYFTIDWTADQIKAITSGTTNPTEIKIYVIATVNKDALIDTGIPNTLDLDYGNYYKAVPKKVETETTKATFDKIDGAATSGTSGSSGSKVHLTGAEFVLVRNSTDTSGSAIKLIEVEKGKTYRIADATEQSGTTSGTVVITTNGNTVTINGLDVDQRYYLLEIKAPTGYNLLQGAVELTKSGTTTFAHQDIKNNKGQVLPSTGGMGTTILYIAGAILVLGAGILLVTKRRANY